LPYDVEATGRIDKKSRKTQEGQDGEAQQKEQQSELPCVHLASLNRFFFIIFLWEYPVG
jgi:hypothetical protein